ncbi:MAG: response regulator transcription factor [Planctomycetes bacterium]|nr:response regulator transcription factor [Planctomycetota bacterium]
MPDSPTVFVVDDDPAVRRAVELLLRSAGMMVETFRTADEFLAVYEPARAGCLVLDVDMPGMTGPDLQDKLLSQGLSIPIVMITGHGDVPLAVGAVRKGAVDFLLKPFDDEVLVERVRQAIDLDVRQRRKAAHEAALRTRLDRLTPREREVLDLLIAGKGNKEIALQLGLSRKTIDIHRSHVMMKLGVDSLLDVAKMGYIPASGKEL